MSVRLGRAVVGGLTRTITRTGLALVVLGTGYQLLVLGSLNTTLAALVPDDEVPDVGLVFPVPEAVANGLLALSVVVGAVYFVVAARTMARPRSALGSFSAGCFSRRMNRATLWTLLAGVLVVPAIALGLLLFILPGLFLAASFAFVVFAIALEDRGPIDGIRRSWRLARGNRLRLGLFIGCYMILSSLVTIPAVIVEVAGAPAVADVINAVSVSAVTVFLYGTLATAYRQVS